MKKFEVCIRGRNFLIKSNGKVRKNGFYAARGVEANTISEAVDLTMNMFRVELKDRVMNEKNDPPSLNVEDASEVYFFQEFVTVEDKDITVPTKGFLWDEELEKEEVVVPISAWRGGWSAFKKDMMEKDLHVHSMAIHFTNALYPVAILFMFLTLFSGKESFRQTYFYLMLLATTSAPISYATGLYEWKRRNQQAMIPIFLTKVRYGLVPFFLGLLCTLWHGISPGVIGGGFFSTGIFLLLNLAILPPIVYLGHLGGIIVYEGVEKER